MKSNFHRKNGFLCCEGVSLEDLCREYGTPAYIYSRSQMEENFRSYQIALSAKSSLICYSVKANSNLAILNLLARLGSGFDIVSEGELARVLAARGDPSKIVFSGVGKTPRELHDALLAEIGCFNIESEAELTSLASIAFDLGRVAPISIRVNPDVDIESHPYIKTGTKENKFGVSLEYAEQLYKLAGESKALDPVGINCHIGSQIMDVDPFSRSLECLLHLVERLSSLGIRLKHIDVGGGLGVSYRDEPSPSPHELIDSIIPKLSGYDLKLVVEPGRSIIANAGVLATKVTYLKNSEHRRFAIVDAAMNDLIRPSLYDAWQEIKPIRLEEESRQLWDVVGPICETADFLGKDRSLALKEGNLLAVMNAGAYGYSMASNYNTRPRPIELLVDKEEVHIISHREPLTSLWDRERLLPESN